MKDKNFLSTTQAAKILGISRIAVYKQIKSGKIKARKVGRNFIIDKDEIVFDLHRKMTEKEKREVQKAVKKVIKEYGETLKLLGST